MKVVIFCAAVVVSIVLAERCLDENDCQITLCRDGTDVICERRECTCVLTKNATACGTLADCDGFGRCPIRGQTWHCVDEQCKCIGI